MPLVNWRCKMPVYSMLYSRLRFGSGLRDCRMPNALLLLGPISLSCAMSSRFRSFHVRLSLARNIGLYALTLSVANLLTYLLTLPLMAVLPSPNRSYDAAEARRQILERRDVHLVEVPRGHEAARGLILRPDVRVEVFPPQAVVECHPPQRPRILSIDAEVGFHDRP